MSLDRHEGLVQILLLGIRVLQLGPNKNPPPGNSLHSKEEKTLHKEKSNKMQQCIKIFIIPYLYEARHVSGDTQPIIRSLKGLVQILLLGIKVLQLEPNKNPPPPWEFFTQRRRKNAS